MGRWVGVAQNQEDALTYLILDDETQQVICRSVVRTAVTTTDPNLRSVTDSPDGGEDFTESGAQIKSVMDLLPPHLDPSEVSPPSFSPHELLGMDFVHTAEDGHEYKARVFQKIHDLDSSDHKDIKFLVDIADGSYEEIMSYNYVCDAVEKEVAKKYGEDTGDDLKYIFKSIIGHEGPLTPNHSSYKGSKYLTRSSDFFAWLLRYLGF